MAHLAEAKSNKSYERQKSSLHKEPLNFLSSLPVPKALPSASPSVIKKFLAWKDNSGKTVVHLFDCPGLGQRQRVSCSCPTRLAAGTVDSLIGKLRSIFVEESLRGEWDDRLGIGNPVFHPSIKAYLKCVREEQPQARVQPRKAVPLFTNKFLAIARSILSKLRNPYTSPLLLYILSRDLSFFCIHFFSGNCSSDLGRTKSKEVLLFPDSSGLLFNHTFGKTLRGNSTHSFSVRSSSNSDICPVRNFMLYLNICRLISVDISQGYLFRASSKAGHISDKPFIGSPVDNRFKQYLKDAGLDGGETPHSLRAGCSITLELLGVSKSDIAKHIGWRSTSMVDHYNDLEQIVKPGHTAEVLSSTASSRASSSATQDAISSYQDVNELKNFSPVFP